MHRAVSCGVGLVAGFIAGVLMSEVIGVVGYLLTRQAVGFRYLPVVTAACGGGLAVVVSRRRRAR